MRSGATILVWLLFLGGCSSSASTEDEVLMGSADAALFLGSTGERVFWDFPKLIVWEGPRGLFYELPRKGILSLSGREARVGAWMEVLRTESLTLEEQVAVSEELQAITGLPLYSTASWLKWGEVEGKRPAAEWKDAFVADRIGRLTSPDYFTRASAIDDLDALYGTTLGYDPKHPPDSLEAGAGLWKARFDARTLPEPAPGPF